MVKVYNPSRFIFIFIFFFLIEHNYRSPARWQDSAEGMVPHHNPVVGGHDLNGEPIYVGRVMHEGDTIPGKVCLLIFHMLTY